MSESRENTMPSIEPQEISETVWYYEEPSGLDFVVEFRDMDGCLNQAIQFRVPWRKLMASAKRCQKIARGK